MSRASKIIRFTAYCLLSFYSSALIGFIAVGMIHTVEHAIAESRLPQTEDSQSHILPFREAGCTPTVNIRSDSEKACLGCSEQQKNSAVMVKYYHILNFHSYPAAAVLHVKGGVKHFRTYSDQNDQASLQPPTPPPEYFLGEQNRCVMCLFSSEHLLLKNFKQA